MRHSVGVRYLESAFLQVIAVIQQRATDEQRTFGVDHHSDVRRLHKNIPVRWSINQIHLVLQSRATATDHSHTQGAVRSTLLRKK